MQQLPNFTRIDKLNNSTEFLHTGRLRKKHGVPHYRYFQNGNTQQYDIFRHNKYNFCVVVCEISHTTPFQLHYVKGNLSCELEKNDRLNGTSTITRQIYTQVYSYKSLLTHHFSRGHNFSYLRHIELKLYTHVDASCMYDASKYFIDILHHS